jgi:hypothetical protein
MLKPDICNRRTPREINLLDPITRMHSDMSHTAISDVLAITQRQAL